MIPMLREVLDWILENRHQGLDTKTACVITQLSWDDTMDLIALGGFVRSLCGPAGVGTCAIVNAKSGRCPENCAFCAQSAHYDTGAPVYPLMKKDALLAAACEMDEHGIGRFGIVTSGTRLTDSELDSLCEAALAIRERCQVSLCGSLGMLDAEKARRLREAGFSRYHHNLETARSYFGQICTTHAYDEDIETLRVARAAGLSLCSCGIFGLGESWAQRVELLDTVRGLGVDALPLNFLSPVPGTPMEKRSPLDPHEALRVVALARLMLPDREIIVCGGRLSTLDRENSWVLAAGASAIMTGNYLTTRGCGYEDDDIMLRSLGAVRR